MNERVKGVLKDLETATQSLQAFADDLWLGINHRDREAREKGTRTFDAYMERVEAFEALAAQVAGLLEPLESSALNGDDADDAPDVAPRVIAQRPSYSLADSFRKRKPAGYQFQDRPLVAVHQWRQWYERLCRDLAALSPGRFAALPDNPKFTTRYGNHLFSRSPADHRVSQLIAGNVYAEFNLPANSMRNTMRDLLTEWGIPHSDLKTYMMEGR